MVAKKHDPKPPKMCKGCVYYWDEKCDDIHKECKSAYYRGKKAEKKRLWEATQDYIWKQQEEKKKYFKQVGEVCGEDSKTYELEITKYGTMHSILYELGIKVFKTEKEVEMYFDKEGLLRRKD